MPQAASSSSSNQTIKSSKELEQELRSKISEASEAIDDSNKNLRDAYQNLIDAQQILMRIWRASVDSNSEYRTQNNIYHASKLQDLLLQFFKKNGFTVGKYGLEGDLFYPGRTLIAEGLDELKKPGLTFEEVKKWVRLIEIFADRTPLTSETPEVINSIANLLLDELVENVTTLQKSDWHEHLIVFNSFMNVFGLERFNKEIQDKVLDLYSGLFFIEMSEDFEYFSRLQGEEKNNYLSSNGRENSLLEYLTQLIEPHQLIRHFLQEKQLEDFLVPFMEINSDAMEMTINFHMKEANFGYTELLRELIILKRNINQGAAAASSSGPEWKPRTSHSQQYRLIVHSYDFDGCTHLKFIDPSQYEKPDYLMVGSTRQSHRVNDQNKRGPIGSFVEYTAANDAFHMLHEWSIDYGIPFSPLLYPDVVNELPVGETFNSLKPHTMDVFYDETKVSLIFTQIWAMALENQEKMIDFHFFDDREEILLAIYSIYSNHPEFVPENLSLHLHQHAPHEDLYKDLPIVRGSGSIEEVLQKPLPLSDNPERDPFTARIKDHLKSQTAITEYCQYALKENPQDEFKLILKMIDPTQDKLFFSGRAAVNDLFDFTSPSERNRYILCQYHEEDISLLRSEFREYFNKKMQETDLASSEGRDELNRFFAEARRMANKLLLAEDEDKRVAAIERFFEFCGNKGIKIKRKTIVGEEKEVLYKLIMAMLVVTGYIKPEDLTVIKNANPKTKLNILQNTYQAIQQGKEILDFHGLTQLLYKESVSPSLTPASILAYSKTLAELFQQIQAYKAFKALPKKEREQFLQQAKNIEKKLELKTKANDDKVQEFCNFLNNGGEIPKVDKNFYRELIEMTVNSVDGANSIQKAKRGEEPQYKNAILFFENMLKNGVKLTVEKIDEQASGLHIYDPSRMLDDIRHHAAPQKLTLLIQFLDGEIDAMPQVSQAEYRNIIDRLVSSNEGLKSIKKAQQGDNPQYDNAILFFENMLKNGVKLTVEKIDDQASGIHPLDPSRFMELIKADASKNWAKTDEQDAAEAASSGAASSTLLQGSIFKQETKENAEAPHDEDLSPNKGMSKK